MIKVRNGMFETNSSSTHTCIICEKDKYVKWCKGNLVYLNTSEPSFNYYADLHNIPIEDGFVEIKYLEDIPLSDIFEKDNYILCRYVIESEGLTFGDVYRLYDKIIRNVHLYDTWDSPEIPIEDKNLKKTIKAILNVSGEDTLSIYGLEDLVNNYMGLIHPSRILEYGDCEERYIDEKTIKGIDIVCINEYGRD